MDMKLSPAERTEILTMRGCGDRQHMIKILFLFMICQRCKVKHNVKDSLRTIRPKSVIDEEIKFNVVLLLEINSQTSSIS